MSSTTTGRSLLLRAERRRRGGSGRTENQRAASTAGRAKRTRRLSWTRWEICPKTESRRRDRTPRAPLWTSEEVRVRSFSDSVKHVEQHPLKWSGNVEWFISRKCLTKETFKFYDLFKNETKSGDECFHWSAMICCVQGACFTVLMIVACSALTMIRVALPRFTHVLFKLRNITSVSLWRTHHFISCRVSKTRAEVKSFVPK